MSPCWYFNSCQHLTPSPQFKTSINVKWFLNEFFLTAWKTFWHVATFFVLYLELFLQIKDFFILAIIGPLPICLQCVCVWCLCVCVFVCVCVCGSFCHAMSFNGLLCSVVMSSWHPVYSKDWKDPLQTTTCVTGDSKNTHCSTLLIHSTRLDRQRTQTANVVIQVIYIHIALNPISLGEELQKLNIPGKPRGHALRQAGACRALITNKLLGKPDYIFR